MQFRSGLLVLALILGLAGSPGFAFATGPGSHASATGVGHVQAVEDDAAAAFGDEHDAAAAFRDERAAAFSGSIASQAGSFDRSTVAITVYANGSARWTFRYARSLANESEVENFRAYAQRFERNRTDLYASFVEDSRALVEQADGALARPMNATAFARSAGVRQSLGNDIGVVTMSFTWTNFAETPGDRVVVGDVFEGGLYLGASQTLVFHPGPTLRFETVRPEATLSNTSSLAASDSVTWEGEREFTDNRPYVVFVPESAASPTATEPTPTTSPGPTTPTEPTPTPLQGVSDGGLPAWAWLVVVLVVGGVALAWYHRGSASGGTATAPDTDDGGASQAAESPSESGPSSPDQNAESAEAREPGEDAASAAEAERDIDDLMEDPLLSDEGRVVALLEANDDRMKQTEIVEETGWSKSKVSMLLSEMAEDGRIEKLRLGRENIITLEEDDDAGDDREE